MTHKRYKVITTIDNIVIVLLIVNAVQKNFLCSFLFFHDHHLGISWILVCWSEY